MKKGLAEWIIVGTLSLAQTAIAGNPEVYQRDAFKGDYQAQRNHAYALFHGEGVPANPLEACAWRLVVFSSQGAKLTDSDISNIWIACQSPDLMSAAVRRAAVILTSLPQEVRAIDRDIRDLTDDLCPGTRCNGEAAAFMSFYKEAMTGRIDAVRQLSRCLSTACAPMGLNFFQSCVWSQVALASVGRTASHDDIRHDKWVCEIDRAAVRDLAKTHMKDVMALMAGAGASTRP